METVAPFPEIVSEIKAAGGAALKYCYQCGKCDTVCPWNTVRNFSIRKIIREATFGLTEIENEEIWRCTTCGKCPSICPRGVKQIELGVSLRRVATNYEVFAGAAEPVIAASASLLTDGNPLNQDRAKRAEWAKDLPVKQYSEDMELLYFVGCYFSYDPRLKKVAAATVKLLNKAGVNFGILGEKEICCGESIRKTGAETVFKTLAKENIRNFIDRGVRKILVSSPHCYHTFKNEYPEFMVHFEVVHISELLAELIADGRLKLTKDFAKKVAFHDPCYLGRHSGIYDAPRELLKAIPGTDIKQLDRSGESSLCCAGGGGRIWAEVPMGERFGELRVTDAINAGAEVLATSCPYCVNMLTDARNSMEKQDVLEIVELAELLVENL